MTKNLFGNLLSNDAMYKASTIVEDISAKVPQRAPFFSTSPTMSWGSVVGYLPGMTELLYGPKSSGKTMIVLDRIKHALASDPECIAIFVDAEMNFEYESTIRWMAANGVDTSRVLIIRDVCIQKIFEKHILETIQKEIIAGNVKVAYGAMDSIAAMSPKNVPQTEAQIKLAAKGKKSYYTNQDYGARANYLSRIFPFFRMFCRDHRVFTTFINQAREDGEDRFGNKKFKTNGGESLYHEVQYRTLVTPWGQPIFGDQKSVINDQNNVKIGHRIKFVFEKNKAGEGQDREGFCDIVYMKGIVNVEAELVALASKLGVINQAGAWFSFDDVKAQGADKMAQHLIENRDLYDIIFSRVMQMASTQPEKAVTFDDKVDPATGEILEGGDE